LEPYAEERFFNENVQIVMFEEESQEPYIITLGEGSLCLYGLKPRTGTYNIDIDVSPGYFKTFSTTSF